MFCLFVGVYKNHNLFYSAATGVTRQMPQWKEEDNVMVSMHFVRQYKKL